MSSKPYYLTCLESKHSNESPLSLRAYARYLGLHPSVLSRVLKGERTLSYNAAETVVEKLKLSNHDRDKFLRSLSEEKETRQRKQPSKRHYHQMRSSRFESVYEWHKIAILDLVRLEDFDASPTTISQRLGIPVSKAHQALDQLEGLGLLYRSENGRICKTHNNLRSPLENLARREYQDHQRQHLRLAEKALIRPEEERVMMGVTMAVDPARLKEARKRIYQFCKELSDYLEGGHRTELFRAQIALFRLDVTTKN